MTALSAMLCGGPAWSPDTERKAGGGDLHNKTVPVEPVEGHIRPVQHRREHQQKPPVSPELAEAPAALSARAGSLGRSKAGGGSYLCEPPPVA